MLKSKETGDDSMPWGRMGLRIECSGEVSGSKVVV
jgi:hypothetical protein